MKNRSVLNSPRLLELKKKKRKVLAQKIFFLVFLFILILVGLSFLSKWEKININNIQISGNKVIETKMIEDIVKADIAGDYLWFFPKTNFLLYPKGEITKELTDKYKRIKNISLNIENLKTLDVSITERTALYTYCGIAPAELDSRNQKCYFMDESGYIFDEAPYFSGEVYTKFYGNTGPYFFEPNFVKLISFKEALKNIGVKPVVFFVEDNGDIEIFLSSTTAQLGPVIFLKADADFNQVVENLQTVLTTEPLQSDFKNKYSSLLYIDLRFGNKVYYKFR
jgi:cell division septal protein FtsQ